MKKLVKGIVIVISTTAFLTGCAAAAPSAVDVPNEDTSEVSNCTKFADFIQDSEDVVAMTALVGGSYAPPISMRLQASYVMEQVGEPMPASVSSIFDKLEFVANSQFAQECMSSALRQELLSYGN
jgi:hypothetical protein